MEVKGVANFLNNLNSLDYRVKAKFYNEDGSYIGCIWRLCKKDVIISNLYMKFGEVV